MELKFGHCSLLHLLVNWFYLLCAVGFFHTSVSLGFTISMKSPWWPWDMHARFSFAWAQKKKKIISCNANRKRGMDPTVWRTISTLHSLRDSSLPGAGIGSELRLRKCSSLYLLKMIPRRWCMPLVYFLSPRVNQDLVDCAEFTGNMTVLFSLIARWNASHNLYNSKNKNKNRLGF